MCGLVGAAGLLYAKEEAAFKNLLKLDAIRGWDSTGVMFGTKTGAVNNRTFNTTLIKNTDVPGPFLKRSNVLAEFRKSLFCLLGHNRAATFGVVNDENAHPFDFPRIVGAHNGTLRTFHDLDNANEFDVDSEALYSHINDHGLRDGLSKIEGAWALTYYDKEERTINFIRNNQRPLWYCFNTAGDAMFWASERWMLFVALSKAGVLHQEPIELPVDLRYTFKIPMAYNEVFEKPLVARIEGGGAVTKKHSASSNGSWNNGLYTPPHERRRLDGSISTLRENLHSQVSGDVMRSYVGKKVSVRVISRLDNKSSGNGFSHLRCEMLGNNKITVKISANPGDKIWKMSEEGSLFFDCTIKRIHKSGRYLLADRRTVVKSGNRTADTVKAGKKEEDKGKVIPFKKEEKTTADDWHIGYAKSIMNTDQWLKKVQIGCSFCTDVPLPSQSSNLHWMSNTEFVCEGCKDLPHVAPYLDQDSRLLH